MCFVGENLWAKGAQNIFGQVWGNWGKSPLHPQKFACSYAYAGIPSFSRGIAEETRQYHYAWLHETAVKIKIRQ